MVNRVVNRVASRVTKVCKEYCYLQKSKLFEFSNGSSRNQTFFGRNTAAGIDNPDEIYNLAETHVESSEFTETVKDIYAETLKLRAIESQIPVVGALDDYTQQEVHTSLTEEPLWLIEHVVENDLPFTEIVTADYAVMDEIVAEIWNDHTYDFSTGGKQQVYWLDNRPVAGLVTSNGMLFRHISNGANYHRSRVNMLTDAFLCESFSGRDIPLTGEIDLSDDEAVAEAVFNQTECIACHQGLDPLAAHFWGFRPRITNASIVNSYSNGCPTNSEYNLLSHHTISIGTWRLLARPRTPWTQLLWLSQ